MFTGLALLFAVSVHPALRFEALPGNEFVAVASGRRVRLSAQSAQFGALHMRFVAGNPGATGTGLDPLPATSNYLLGSDQRKWRTNVANFSEVRFAGVYPGIDLIYKGDGQRIEYDFAIAPHADPTKIRMEFPGATVRVDGNGDLLVQSGDDILRLRAPIAFQDSHDVPVRFAVLPNQEVQFRVARYDHSKPLIIDPTIVYSTYIEAADAQSIPSVAVDSAGNVYVAGSTLYAGVPVTNALRSPCPGQTSCSAIYVDKFDSTGKLVYATLVGGSAVDQVYALAVDAAGNTYVTGLTTSPDFPMVNPLPQSKFNAGGAFVLKLNAAGTAVTFSTYLSGSSTGPGAGIAVDSSGNIYVTGWTFSSDFPTVNALQPVYGGKNDAFVAKMNPATSTLVYSTYLGGANIDEGHGIAVDASGNAYVTGYTGSVDFPTHNALQPTYGGATVDAFVTKISPTGALLYSTYLGGNLNDEGDAIAVDSTGAVYVTGSTSSPNFPTAAAVQAQYQGVAQSTNAFVTKIAASGAALVYSTYLGGQGFDIGYGIAVDAAGNATVVGQTISNNFPAASAVQSVSMPASRSQGFVSKLTSNGSQFIYSTYLGGSSQSLAQAVALDASGQVYVTGLAYLGFPVLNAYQPNAIPNTTTSTQAFLTRISDGSAACAYGISPTATALAVAGAASTGMLTGIANSSTCTWQTTSNAPWLTITQGASGTGIAPVGYAVAQNPNATARAGVLTVAGQNIAINQSAASHFTLGSVSGAAGSVARIPLTFVPDLATSLYGLSVTIAVSPAPGAPSFQASPVLSPPQTTVSAGQITLTWANLAGLSNQVALGEIVVPVPASATAGQLYMAQVTTATINLGNGVNGVYAIGSPATITVGNPTSVVTWMTPSAAVPGSAATTVVVRGEGFSSPSTVLWNGTALATQFISETQLQATIPAANLVTAATVPISVSGGTGMLNFLVVTGTAPVISAGGVVNSASYTTGITGGSIAAVFGTNLAPAHVHNFVLPLPTQLGGVMVLVDGISAPLFDVTSTQITFQVPWRLLSQTQATIAVVVNGVTSNALTVTSAASAPAIFATNSQGFGQGAVLYNSSPVLVDASNPGKAGSLINVFATGLGATSISVADGIAGGGSVPSLPAVTIGGIPAQVGFAGIGGYVSLYQINVTIPSGVPSGPAIPLILSVSGVPSNTVMIAIQ